MATNGRTVVPTAVRCEALWDRTQQASTAANLHVHDDDPLDPAAANRNVQLRQAVPSASLVDANVIVDVHTL